MASDAKQLSDRLEQVVRIAQAYASRHGHEAVDTEHLLQGVLEVEPAAFGARADAVSMAVAATLRSWSSSRARGQTNQFTRAANGALRLASEAALARGDAKAELPDLVAGLRLVRTGATARLLDEGRDDRSANLTVLVASGRLEPYVRIVLGAIVPRLVSVLRDALVVLRVDRDGRTFPPPEGPDEGRRFLVLVRDSPSLPIDLLARHADRVRVLRVESPRAFGVLPRRNAGEADVMRGLSAAVALKGRVHVLSASPRDEMALLDPSHRALDEIVEALQADFAPAWKRRALWFRSFADDETAVVAEGVSAFGPASTSHAELVSRIASNLGRPSGAAPSVLVVAPSGAGKSAVFRDLHRRLDGAGYWVVGTSLGDAALPLSWKRGFDLARLGGVGPPFRILPHSVSADQVLLMSLISRLTARLPSAEPGWVVSAERRSLEEQFLRAAQKAARTRPAWLLLDGLDRLGADAASRLSAALCRLLAASPRPRIVCLLRPGGLADTLRADGLMEEVHLSSPTSAAAVEYARESCARAGLPLDPSGGPVDASERAWFGEACRAGPLALGLAVENRRILMVTGAGVPGTAVGCLEVRLAEAERRLGAPLAGALLRALAVVRDGLSEFELWYVSSVLLGQTGHEREAEAVRKERAARAPLVLKACLGSALTLSDSRGRWSLAYGEVRTIALGRYCSDGESLKRAHAALVHTFLHQPDPAGRGPSPNPEAVHHAIESSDAPTLARAIGPHAVASMADEVWMSELEARLRRAEPGDDATCLSMLLAILSPRASGDVMHAMQRFIASTDWEGARATEGHLLQALSDAAREGANTRPYGHDHVVECEGLRGERMHQRGEHSAALEAYRNAIDAAMPRFRAFGGDPVLLGGRTGMLKRGVGAVLSDQGHSHQAMEVFGESVADLRSALVDAAHLAPESRRWLVEALQTSLLSLAAEASKALLVDRSATAFREAIDVVAQDPKPSLTLLRRAAQACERSAELSDVTGDRRAVLSDRERCARLRRDVVAQADSPASRLALANAEFEVAGALCALGRSDDATAPLRRAESIAEGVAGVADVSDAAKDLLARIDFAIRDIDGRHGS